MNPFNNSRISENGKDRFRIYESISSDKSAPLFIFHHGGGHCGFVWSLVCAELMSKLDCSVLAFDCRGHGKTETEDESDLSLNTLADDLSFVIGPYLEEYQIILVGHSMGGAVITEFARRNLVKSLTGVVVIDVVEGSAIDSLAYMNSFLTSRLPSFLSIEEAVKWSLRSHQLLNKDSAKISIPHQLVRVNQGDETVFIWRTDLFKSKKYWEEWFKGMSSKFLSVRAAKLLILAGTDRLDKELTIAQMQGKYQLSLFPEAGHSLHEDCPSKLADVLAEFWTRNKPAKIKKFVIKLNPSNVATSPV